MKVESVDTREPQRDEHLRSPDFFEVETYPEIAFQSTAIRPVDEEEFEIEGDLTIHGVTRSVKFQATLEGTETDLQGNDRVGVSARGQINRSDFDIKFNAALGSGNVVVSDKVKILLDVSAVRPPEGADAQRMKTSPSASSTAASVWASSAMPEAEALACTCSGRLAPTIAEATLGWRSTQASASCAIDSPRLSATGTRRCTASSTRSSISRSMKPLMLSLAARESGGGCSPGRYLPVSTPWPSGDHTIWEISSRSHSGITSASGPRHSIEYCGWLETQRATSGQREGRFDLLHGPLAEADVARLARATTSLSAPIVSSSGV